MHISNRFQQLATATFLGNVGKKLVTFFFNALLVRKAKPEMFGVAQVQLQLLLNSLLFLSREGVRLAVLKRGYDDNNDTINIGNADVEITSKRKIERQKVVNLSWVPALVLFCGVLFIGAFYAFISFGSSQNIVLSTKIRILSAIGINTNSDTINGNNSDDSNIHGISAVVVLLYCMGALLECCAEPWINQYQVNLIAGPKARAEGIAVAVKSLSSYVFVAVLQWGVVGFGLAQVLYGVTILLVAIMQSHLLGSEVHIQDMLPAFLSSPLQSNDVVKEKKHNRKISKQPLTKKRVSCADDDVMWNLLDSATLQLAGTITCSSLLKHGLTEADKIVLTFTRDSHDQGIYALCNNYGGLIARILWQPLEESCRSAFARLALQSSSSSSNNNNNNNNKNSDNLDTPEVDLIATMFRRSLLFVGFVGASITAIGPSYVHAFMTHMLASQWRSKETLQTLTAFCLYIFVLGINGVSEALMYAVAPPAHFLYINSVMVLSTITYAFVVIHPTFIDAVVTYDYKLLTANTTTGVGAYEISEPLTGAARIVYANISGMCVRAIFAGGYGMWYLSTHNQNIKKKSEISWPIRVAIFLACEVAAASLTRRSKEQYDNAQVSGVDGFTSHSALGPLMWHLLSGLGCGILVTATTLCLLPDEDSEALLGKILKRKSKNKVE